MGLKLKLQETAEKAKQGPTILRLLIRGFQLLLAVVVVGLYTVHLDAERKSKLALDNAFLFAVITPTVCGSTCVFYIYSALSTRKGAEVTFSLRALLLGWEAILFLCWMAVFGIFAKLFLIRSDKPEDMFENTNTQRMKNAVWVDLANAVLWLGTTGWQGFILFKVRRQGRRAEDEESWRRSQECPSQEWSVKG